MTERSDVVRTPDANFDGLPGYPWSPNYVSDLPGYEGLRMHYLQEGPADARHVYLCLHGQPTWSYLYRKMIPVFLESGGAVVAPDLFGFGRSDKPTDDASYTFDFHRGALLALIERLGLERITLVCQDWGGILGLTLPMEHPERFERLIVMNTAIVTGVVDPGPAFRAWQTFVATHPDLDVAGIMRRATPGITEEEAAAYGAPYPDVASKAGARVFPALVPVTPEMPGAEIGRQAVGWWQSSWKGRAFMAVGMKDKLLGELPMRMLHSLIPGCAEPMMLEDVDHFVQEQHGEAVARAALAYFESV